MFASLGFGGGEGAGNNEDGAGPLFSRTMTNEEGDGSLERADDDEGGFVGITGDGEEDELGVDSRDNVTGVTQTQEDGSGMDTVTATAAAMGAGGTATRRVRISTNAAGSGPPRGAAPRGGSAPGAMSRRGQAGAVAQPASQQGHVGMPT